MDEVKELLAAALLRYCQHNIRIIRKSAPNRKAKNPKRPVLPRERAHVLSPVDMPDFLSVARQLICRSL